MNAYKLFLVSCLLAFTVSAGAEEQLSLEKAELLYTKGRIAFYDGDYEKASQFFSDALKANPNRNDIVEALALTRMKTAKYSEAASTMETAVAKDPDNVDLLFDLGMAYYELGEYEKARNTLKTAIEDKKADGAEFHYYYGLSSYRLGDYNKALEELTKAHEIDNSFTQIALYYKGFVFEAQGKREQAMSTWQIVAEDTSTEIGVAAKQLVEGEEKKEEGGETDLFVGYLELGAQYDSNAILLPSDSAFSDSKDFGQIYANYMKDDEIQKDDFKGLFSTALTLNAFEESNHLAGVTLAGSTNYHMTDVLRDFNYSAISGGPFYQYVTDALYLRLPITGEISFLGDSFDVYAVTYDTSPNVLYQWTEFTLTRLAVPVSYASYRDVEDYADRTGLSIGPELGEYFQVLNNKLVFGVNGKFYQLGAKGNDWKHIAYGGNGSVIYHAPFQMDFNAFGGVLLRDFKNALESPVVKAKVREELNLLTPSAGSDQLPDIPEDKLKRKDTALNGGLVATYYFSDNPENTGFSASLGGQYYKNISTISFYEYDRFIATMAFSYAF